MKDVKREDIKLFHGGRYTKKFMENGEVRTRLVVSDGTRMSHTEMCDYDISAGDLPWQDAHLHQGLIEQYTLIEGWAYFISEYDAAVTSHCTRIGETIKFAPGVPHVVLLGPNAKITTVLFGTPVPNPERKGEDWWPADNMFVEAAALQQSRCKEEVLRSV